MTAGAGGGLPAAAFRNAPTDMASTVSYDAFLSYNSTDATAVQKIAAALNEKGCRTFLDRWYLEPGRDWVDALERALSASRSVAVFLGAGEMGRWQQRERTWALDRQAGDAQFAVIPVLLPGSEPPLGFMQQLMWIDLREGIDQADSLERLARAIRGESVAPDGRREPRAMVCPYRGLLHFREEDAAFFFGRDVYIESLVQKVSQHNLVAVVGGSGSGKSSVVRAGLVPRLRRLREPDVWDIVTMVPREDPLFELAKALAPLVEPDCTGEALLELEATIAKSFRAGNVPLWRRVEKVLEKQAGTTRLLLVVDQWEELYTLCKSDEDRQRFLDELLTATGKNESKLSVVLTVRSDFYDNLLRNRPLMDQLRDGRVDLSSMNRDELRATIEQPAAAVGMSFEPGLVDGLLTDAGDEPGRLALLEFALKELWGKHNQGRMTHAAYETLGRLSGAIANHADAALEKLDPEARAAVPGLFRRLVSAGAKSADDTRQRADLRGLDVAAQRVVQVLSGREHRLLVTARAEEPGPTGQTVVSETVEVAHEELLRSWGQLKGWIDEDRKFLQWHARLATLLVEHTRDPNLLLQSGALREAAEFFPARSSELDVAETSFIRKSLQAKQRRRTGQQVSGVLLVVVLSAAGWWIRDTTKKTQAANLAGQIVSSDLAGLPDLVKKLPEFGGRVEDVLRQKLTDLDSPDAKSAQSGDQKTQQEAARKLQKLHICLSLIQSDPAQLEFVVNEFLDAKPEAVPHFLTLLEPRRMDLAGEDSVGGKILWNTATWPTGSFRRLHAAAALGKFDPQHANWQKPELPQNIARQLVAVGSTELGSWIGNLRLIADRLIEPLAEVIRERTPERAEHRAQSAAVLGEYAIGRPQLVVELALLADSPREFQPLVKRLAASAHVEIPASASNGILVDPEQWYDPLLQVLDAAVASDASAAEREVAHRRQAQAAVCLFEIEGLEQLRGRLGNDGDPTLRSHFLERLGTLGTSLSRLAMRLSDEQDPVWQQVLILAMGQLDPFSLSVGEQRDVVGRLAKLYRDPGQSGRIHSAAGWTLRNPKWKAADQVQSVVDEARQEWVTADSSLRQKLELRTWHMNSLGMTMLRIDPGEFKRQDDVPSSSSQLVKLTRTWFMADCEVTISQFQQFINDMKSTCGRLTRENGFTSPDRKVGPNEECPVQRVNWSDAVLFCNWLSCKEGFSLAYTPDNDDWVLNLESDGYRLPTEAEWEYACRAGSMTAFHFGGDECLLARYAWFSKNSGSQSYPKALKMPNGWGFYDMHGSVWEWCHDWQGPFLTAGEEDPQGPEKGTDRVIRGGSWNNVESLCCSTYRDRLGPNMRTVDVGFRVARSRRIDSDAIDSK